MRAKQKELNANKPNREDSFHAERKRKTATKCKNALKDMCAPSRSSKKKTNSLPIDGDTDGTSESSKEVSNEVLAVLYS